MPESALRKVMTMLEVEMPDTSDIPDCSPAEAVAAALSLKVCEQEMCAQALQEMLLGRLLNDDSVDQGFLDNLSDEMVNDVVLLKDQRDSRKFLQSRQEAISKRECRRRQASASRSAAKKAAPKPKPTKAGNKLQSRVYAGMDDEPFRILLAHKPGAARVIADAFNGRYRLSCLGGYLRSVSWTGRDHGEAIRVALEQVWQWEEAATRRGIPAEVAAIMADKFS